MIPECCQVIKKNEIDSIPNFDPCYPVSVLELFKKEEVSISTI